MAITMEIMNNSELVKFAKSELIKSINTEVDTIEEYIKSEEKALTKLIKGEVIHEVSYRYLYSLNYKKVWLLSKLYDLENN